MPQYNFCPVCGAALALKNTDEEIPRLACSLTPTHFVHYNNPNPVVAAIIEFEGQVLLARNVKWPLSWFALVTGFLEANETPEAGIQREVMEEVGLESEVVGLVGVYPFFVRNEIIIAYHVKAYGNIQLGHEIAATKLVPKNELIPWQYATGDAVRDWLKSQGILDNVDKTLSFK